MPDLLTEPSERLWSRGLHAAGLAVAIVATTALAVVLYLPLKSREADLETQLSGAWQLLGDSERISSEHADALTALERTEVRIRTLREQIPETAQEALFLAQISHLAEKSGFEIVDYRPGSAEPHEFCQQIRVQVRGRGQYESVCRFAAGLDQLPRLCRTTSFTVNVGGADAAAPAEKLCDVELSLTIFFAVRQDALDAAKEKRNG